MMDGDIVERLAQPTTLHFSKSVCGDVHVLRLSCRSRNQQEFLAAGSEEPVVNFDDFTHAGLPHLFQKKLPIFED